MRGEDVTMDVQAIEKRSLSPAIGMFTKAMKEVVGESAEDSAVEAVRKAISQALEKNQYTLLQVAATKTG